MSKSVLNRIRAVVKRFYRAIRLELSDNYSLSLGENCLTDNILSRHGLKSFSTPYSHGRTNIDYAINFEKESYASLMDDRYLAYEIFGKDQVIRNRKYIKTDPIYIDIHRNGFELTHHDVLGSKSHRRSYFRKINRLRRYRGRKNIRFYYHYRMNADRDLDRLFKKAEEFLSFYQINGRKCTLHIFTQDIVSKESEREIVEIRYSDTIRAYILKTMSAWAGAEGDEFWARNDDDLIKKMLEFSIQ